LPPAPTKPIFSKSLGPRRTFVQRSTQDGYGHVSRCRGSRCSPHQVSSRPKKGRPECLGEWRKILCRAQNFFKHADDDATNTLFFAPQITHVLILEACERHQMQAYEHSPLMRLFVIWFSLHEPHLLLPDIQQRLRDVDPTDDLTRLGKLQFFHLLLSEISTIDLGFGLCSSVH
jgi:hypothetical protein